MDLIHPHSKRDVMDALRGASAAGTRVLIVGGRRHIDKGNPSEVDAELWTTLLDDRVAYDPAEMLCVVEGGCASTTSARCSRRVARSWRS